MYEAITNVARRMNYFTTDYVIAWHLEFGHGEDTREWRALGPMMLRAARDGICVKAGPEFRMSVRRSRHKAPLQLWRSLLYSGQPEPVERPSVQ